MTGDDIIDLLEQRKKPLSFRQIKNALPEYSEGRLNQILHRLVKGKYILTENISNLEARRISPAIKTGMRVYYVRKKRIKKEVENSNGKIKSINGKDNESE